MRRTVSVAIGILIIMVEACAIVETPSLAPTETVQWIPTALPASTLPPTLLPADTLTSTVQVALTELPTSTPTQTLLPADAPTLTARPQPSETQIPDITPTLSCETHTASLVLTASTESLKVGDTVIVIAKLNNEGCLTLGLPQYRLYIQSDISEPIFTPDKLDPVVHYLGVDPGDSDTVEFELRAIASGQVTLTAMVSFEVHLGYPGPAYWGATSTTEPLIIIVAP